MIVGTVCYATNQGLGMLAKSFYEAGVITEVLIFKHRSRHSHLEWYPENTPVLVDRPFSGPDIKAFLEKVDVVLFFETPFDWQFLKLCKDRGVKTVLIPMYEWYLKNPPHEFDFKICPSRLDADYFPPYPYVPIPVPQNIWKLRTTARTFVHNSGHIGYRTHKGTVELLKAMRYVKSPLSLTIRSQEPGELNAIIQRNAPEIFDDKRVTLSLGEIPYEDLWKDFDVYVAPEKFNGLSLPLQEARAAGMYVVTTDRYPTNTWINTSWIIPVTKKEMTQVSGAYLPIQECVIDPKNIATILDNMYGSTIENYSCESLRWVHNNSWEVLKPRYMEILNGVVNS